MVSLCPTHPNGRFRVRCSTSTFFFNVTCPSPPFLLNVASSSCRPYSVCSPFPSFPSPPFPTSGFSIFRQSRGISAFLLHLSEFFQPPLLFCLNSMSHSVLIRLFLLKFELPLHQVNWSSTVSPSMSDPSLPVPPGYHFPTFFLSLFTFPSILFVCPSDHYSVSFS